MRNVGAIKVIKLDGCTIKKCLQARSTDTRRFSFLLMFEAAKANKFAPWFDKQWAANLLENPKEISDSITSYRLYKLALPLHWCDLLAYEQLIDSRPDKNLTNVFLQHVSVNVLMLGTSIKLLSVTYRNWHTLENGNWWERRRRWSLKWHFSFRRRLEFISPIVINHRQRDKAA